MVNSCRKVLFSDREPVRRIVAGRYCFVMQSQLDNCCTKVLFCDGEPVWRIVAGRYCFVIRSQCGELFQEGMFFFLFRMSILLEYNLTQ